jgi:hypothetical protein
MLRCGLAVRRVTKSAASMEEAADAIVRHLHESCVGGDGTRRACPLVRFYKTHPFSDLDPALQTFARTRLGGEPPTPDMKCLVLLASAGEELAWNDRRLSRQHRAIPLPSEQIVAQAPMIAQLVTQLGLPLGALVRPSPQIVGELEGRTYNVFHVEEAAGSPYIPAQADFVVPHAIRSVVGFGGVLRTGDLFAVILFSRAHIRRDVAERFRTIGLDVKSAVFRFKPDEIFAT